MQILNHLDLAAFHTFALHAKADRLYKAETRNDLQALHAEGVFNRPFHILGAGSNTLFLRDMRIPIVQVAIEGIKLVEAAGGGADSVFIQAEAGTGWHSLVKWAVDRGLGGIEHLALIPGTCGAAPIQNIGAYGRELSDVLRSVEVFDARTGRYSVLPAEDCGLGYRDSVFKQNPDAGRIIVSITLELRAEPDYRPETAYRSLREELSASGIEQPGIRDVFDAVCKIRSSKLPDPARVPNAGSFFKNPVVERELADSLKKTHPEMPVFPLPDGRAKLAAGWLIEKTGWKGRMVDNVGTWPDQALVLHHNGKATPAQVRQAVERILRDVHRMFGIRLTPEVVTPGFDRPNETPFAG